MLLEQRELSKRVSALLEIRREKNLSTSRRSLKTWSKPDSNSSSIESADLLNKPSKKETSSWESLWSKRRLRSKREESKRRRKKSWRSTLLNWGLKSMLTKINLSRRDLTTSRRVERSGQRSRRKRERLKPSSTRNLSSSITLRSQTSTRQNWQRKRYYETESICFVRGYKVLSGSVLCAIPSAIALYKHCSTDEPSSLI